MGIIDELIKEIKTSDMTIQIQEICNKIWEEEKRNITHQNVVPDGANIFLAVQVPGRNKKDISFITLERDPLEEYVAVYYSIPVKEIRTDGLPRMPKRFKSHRLEGLSAKKIMGEFAKLVKFYRGE
jgi:hypothetical protein